MAGYNRVVMIGNLTRDPEYKQLSSGQAVCRLGLASNRQFKNRQTGSMVQEVCYIDIDVWGAQAESCRQYLQKGRAVLIEGRIKLDSWEDANGQNRSKHSIVADRVVFLSSQGEAGVEEEEEEFNPNSKMERDLKNQINDIKARTQAKKTESAEPARAVKAAVSDKPARAAAKPAPAASGEIEFQDEPPFQDDLPF